jgi:hypothetical protein
MCLHLEYKISVVQPSPCSEAISEHSISSIETIKYKHIATGLSQIHTVYPAWPIFTVVASSRFLYSVMFTSNET